MTFRPDSLIFVHDFSHGLMFEQSKSKSPNLNPEPVQKHQQPHDKTNKV